MDVDISTFFKKYSVRERRHSDSGEERQKETKKCVLHKCLEPSLSSHHGISNTWYSMMQRTGKYSLKCICLPCSWWTLNHVE